MLYVVVLEFLGGEFVIVISVESDDFVFSFFFGFLMEWLKFWKIFMFVF